MRYILIAIILVLFVIIGPFLTIWSLNTLFPVLAIQYTFETWCATVLLQAAIRGLLSMKFKSNED